MSAVVDVEATRVLKIIVIGFGLTKRFGHVRDTTQHSDVESLQQE